MFILFSAKRLLTPGQMVSLGVLGYSVFSLILFNSRRVFQKIPLRILIQFEALFLAYFSSYFSADNTEKE